MSLALLASSASAQYLGDAQRGEALVGVCAACHGPGGKSLSSEWPHLAGQNERYLYRQMKRIRDGQRSVPTMLALNDKDDSQLADIAAYFSAQPAPTGETDPQLLEAGRQLYLAGDAERGIAACTACHGVTGSGLAGAGFPRLSGQVTAYLEQSLHNFRAEGATNDVPSSMMRQIARRLHDDDIKAVASYISGLHERPRGE